ncbi:protein KRI1 homolog [Saccostrea echinata]|uniref:protein KRI1 homolog n=1 Tax=Saccostrea echinata TaxID=191078 RepID=UPI002A808617|nr:protein KRI1 homolog [Saccostrea echinata]
MSESSDEDSGGFKINKSYASKYNDWRRREELQKLRDRYGDDAELEEDSSSSESEDEDAEALTAQLEEDWFKTLAALKSKDPRIYDKNVKFYHSEEEKSDDSSDEPGPSNKKEKPVYLKDYQRKVILEKEGMVSDEESDEDEEISHEPGYYEEQEEIKKSFKEKLAEESDSEGELFTKRLKTKEQEEEEEKDYIKWLKDQKDLEERDPVGVELAPLKSYWNDPKLSANEKFLRDLILNKGYIDKDGRRLPSYNEIVDDGEGFSEEEEILEREDQFERKYNFRFEEPDPDFIKSYPRTIKDSVRQKDTKRAEKRKELKKRKDMEKQKIKEEVKQLKNLKRKEIMDKIDKLREITGDPDLDFNEEDLETDFDPQKHDEMMKKYFDDEFYEMEEGDQKPEAPADIEDIQCENWDEWNGGDVKGYDEEYNDIDDNYEPHVDDPDFCMDDDYDPTKIVSRKKNKKRKSKFVEAVTTSKPTFDPNEKTFEEYFEEYYKLDYEDIVAGQPCRFKYRNVTPNSYGLEVDEILKCRDKELNAWVSVKKMSQYREKEEEEREVKIFESKGKNQRKKMNVLLSLNEETEEIPVKKVSATSTKSSPGKKKKRKNADNESIDNSEGQTVKKSKKDNLNDSKEIKGGMFTRKIDKRSKSVVKESPKKRDRKQESRNIGKDVYVKIDSNDMSMVSDSEKKIRESKEHEEKVKFHSESEESKTKHTEKGKKSKKKKSQDDGKTLSQEASENDTGNRLSGGIKEAKRLDTVNSPEDNSVTTTPTEYQQMSGDTSKKRKNKRKKKKKKGGPPKLSSERLLAFGINPKKVKYMNINKFKEQTQG